MDSIQKHPAAFFGGNWREGTPLGNGLHGALLYGGTAHERVMLSHTRLWRGGLVCDLPDVHGVLPRMRQLLREGKAPQADTLLADALRQQGYAPREAFPLPAADILLDQPLTRVFSGYERRLDMERAVAAVTYRDGDTPIRREAFVSRADDVVVIRCAGCCQVSLAVHQPDDAHTDRSWLPRDPETREETRPDGRWLFFCAVTDGQEHGVVARVCSAGADTLILARIYTDGGSAARWPELQQSLAALPADWDTLLARHVPLHRELFDRCRLTLGDGDGADASNEALLEQAFSTHLPQALAQRLWAFGRYLFISAAATEGYPCALTGLWSGEYHAFWAFNMANINIEMIYWHAMGGQLPELTRPLFDYYDAGMKEMQCNARQIYGCSGIFLPAVTMPGGMRHVCVVPHITNWTAGAGWMAQHYYDYWIYTADGEFLRYRALPFMREAARFYMDFVVWEGETWHVLPSVSPENRTTDYRHTGTALGEGTQCSIDASMDVAVIRELFRHLTDIADRTGEIPPEERSAYQRMLDGAPAYRYRENGAPREWLHPDFPDNDHHRHQSHLYPMFPGDELPRRDAATDAAYRQGGLERMTTGREQQTSWSLTQNAHLMARVRDGELAYENLDRIAKTCVMNNLFTTHNDWWHSGMTLDMAQAPFQIDANIGFVSAVQEMLLYSDRQRLDVLPALPEAWTQGSIGALWARCGVLAEITWADGGCSVCLTARRDTDFTLYMPGRESETLHMNEKDTLTRTGTLCSLRQVQERNHKL